MEAITDQDLIEHALSIVDFLRPNTGQHKTAGMEIAHGFNSLEAELQSLAETYPIVKSAVINYAKSGFKKITIV